MFPKAQDEVLKCQIYSAYCHRGAKKPENIHISESKNFDLMTVTLECVDWWNETKAEWRANPSPLSVQAASHCRFKPKQQLMLSEGFGRWICDHTQSREYRI